MNILIHKYHPYAGHPGPVFYRACAYIEDSLASPREVFVIPEVGEPIPLSLHPDFTDGRSRDVLYRDEVDAAIAELRRRSSRNLSVRTANVTIIDRPMA